MGEELTDKATFTDGEKGTQRLSERVVDAFTHGNIDLKDNRPNRQSGLAQPETDAEINAVRRRINSIVGESKLPVEGETSYAIYGGKLSTDPEGKIVYDMRLRHVQHDLDRAGDRFLRSVEDHQMKRPLKTFLRNPIKFFKYVPTMMPFILTKPKAMRYRGEKQAILNNVHRLGLDDYYGPHSWGVEFKKPELLRKGMPLQDIMRNDHLKREGIEKIDRFDALGQAGDLLNRTHAEHGAVGEFNAFAVIFEDFEDGKVANPVLYLPTIVYNEEKNFGEVMKKATDLLDFMVSAGAEEARRRGADTDIKRAIVSAISRYDDEKVIKMTSSLAKRGRLTLPGDEDVAEDLTATGKAARKVFSQHNVQRLNIKPENSADIRKLVIEICEDRIREIENENRGKNEDQE
jgi:hypothetical protein